MDIRAAYLKILIIWSCSGLTAFDIWLWGSLICNLIWPVGTLCRCYCKYRMCGSADLDGWIIWVVVAKPKKIRTENSFGWQNNPRKDVHFDVLYYFFLWQSASTYDPTPREAQTVKYKTVNELTDLPMWAIYVIIGVSALIMIALVATIIAVSLIHALLASRKFSNFWSISHCIDFNCF